MTDKKKASDKAQSVPQVSDEEAANVKGGLMQKPGVGGLPGGNMSFTSDSCKETTDTGMMGCSG